MTFEQKTVNVINILSRDYINLIGLEGLGLYVFLMRHEITSMGIMNVPALTKALNIDDEKFALLIKRLNKCGLITLKKKGEDKYSYKTQEFRPLSYSEKLHMLDLLYDDTLLSYNEKKSLEFLMNLDHKYINLSKNSSKKNSSKENNKRIVKEIDLEKSEKRRNPNSFPALVDYYYNMLSKQFGIYCKSYNIVAEARLLKNSMRENNDSPEKVKKMFEYIISDAKSRDKIELVNHIGLYTRKRSIAYYHLFSNQNTKPEFATSLEASDDTEVDIKYIKNAYDYYKQKEYEHDIILKDILEPQFGKKSVDNFVKYLEKE